MKQTIYRASIIVGAILMGILLVLFLTMIGNKTTGPIEDTFTAVGNQVSSIENKFILQSRKHTRSEKLHWFDEYRNDKLKIANPDKLLLGAYDNEFSESFQSVVELENSLQTTFPLIHIYTAWGSKPEQKFPALQVKAILDLGSIPIITWEPWLTDFSPTDYPKIPADPKKRDKGGLKSIAKGNYDNYINKWAHEVKEIGRPVFIRLGHEMNDPYRYPWGPQNNKPADFIEAWRHVVQQFKNLGADNVIWIWSPHPAYLYFDYYYPGDKYVDWVGVGTLNYGTVATWSQWWTFDEIFGNYYDQLSKYNKPIMISEFGSLDVGGSRSKWFEDALLSMPVKYPAIKAVIFFHCSSDITTTNKALNWYFKDDSIVTRVIINTIERNNRIPVADSLLKK
jgi:hypothetical protein